MITKGPTIWTALEWNCMLLNKESELYERRFKDMWNIGDGGCLRQLVSFLLSWWCDDPDCHGDVNNDAVIVMIVTVKTCKRRVSMWWWRRQSQLPDCPEFDLSLKFNLILKFSKQDLIQIQNENLKEFLCSSKTLDPQDWSKENLMLTFRWYWPIIRETKMMIIMRQMR